MSLCVRCCPWCFGRFKDEQDLITAHKDFTQSCACFQVQETVSFVWIWKVRGIGGRRSQKGGMGWSYGGQEPRFCSVGIVEPLQVLSKVMRHLGRWIWPALQGGDDADIPEDGPWVLSCSLWENPAVFTLLWGGALVLLFELSLGKS